MNRALHTLENSGQLPSTDSKFPGAHGIVIRAVDCAAITPAQIPDVLLEWRKPSHEEFAPRNAFSLWNAFTEVFKTVNPHTAMRRGEALHGLLNAETGVALVS